MARPQLANLPTFALVAAGGALGASTRWVIDEAIAADTAGVAWEIVAINIVGAFALGAVTGRFDGRPSPAWLPVVGPGFLGAFTTYSAAAAAVYLVDAHGPLVWAALLGTIATAAVAAGSGWAWGARRPAGGPT